MVDEQWMPVFGFLGYYEVSNLGRVKSIRTGKIMNPRLPKKSGEYGRMGDGIR